MATTILVKRSNVASKIPLVGDLQLGEIAVNTYDGKMYIKRFDGVTETIVDVTGAQQYVASDTAPTNPAPGTEWFDTSSGVLYTYVDDGVGAAQWVELGSIGNMAGPLLSVTDLTTYDSTSGTGSTAILSTITSPSTDEVLTWDGSNWVNQSVAAGGNPNLTLNNQLGYEITTTLADSGVSVPAGSKGIVRSIHVTNISGSSTNLTAEINYGGSNPISLADAVPVEAGSGIDLLIGPKVISNGDTINFLASAASSLHVTIIWEETTDTTYFGGGVDLTTNNTLTDLYISTGAPSILESILVSNDSPTESVPVRVIWTDGSDVIQGYYAYDVIIPLQATVEMLIQPKRIPAGHKIRVSATLADHVEVHIAGKTQ